MKKCVIVTFTIIFFLVSGSMQVAAGNVGYRRTSSSSSPMNVSIMGMTVFENGRDSEKKMLGHIRIGGNRQEDRVVQFSFVYIFPVHETKEVALQVRHYSTSEGTIKDVKVNKNGFSFTIDVTDTPAGLGTGGNMKVVGTRKQNMFDYSVNAKGIWWNSLLDRKVETEWRLMSNEIVLPYKRVTRGYPVKNFGVGAPGRKPPTSGAKRPMQRRRSMTIPTRRR
jgi:hypothetical protein